MIIVQLKSYFRGWTKSKFSTLSTFSKTNRARIGELLEDNIQTKIKNWETFKCNFIYNHFKTLYATYINIDENELLMHENQHFTYTITDTDLDCTITLSEFKKMPFSHKVTKRAAV